MHTIKDATSKVVAFIPVRGGSKSIPLKNIKLLAGKPLVHWTIEAALDCPVIDRVFISTDSVDIENNVQQICSDRLSIISRSKESATDSASSELALLEFCLKFNFHHVFFIQATSPLLTADNLSEAFNKYTRENCDSMLSVVRQKRFIWQENSGGYAIASNYDIYNRPRRQEFDGFLVENGAFYLSARERILASKNRLSGNIGFYEMPASTYFEIDEPDDWIITENILKTRKITGSFDKLNLHKIKMLVMDVDGVLTDAGMYYTQNGDELKKFNTHDGKGIELLRHLGIKTAIITTEDTKIVERRAIKLKIDYVYQGISDKEAALRKLAQDTNLPLAEIIYIGDDVNDLPAFKIAGIRACPQNALADVKKEADICLSKNGGDGALRELCEMIINARKNK